MRAPLGQELQLHLLGGAQPALLRGGMAGTLGWGTVCALPAIAIGLVWMAGLRHFGVAIPARLQTAQIDSSGPISRPHLMQWRASPAEGVVIGP